MVAWACSLLPWVNCWSAISTRYFASSAYCLAWFPPLARSAAAFICSIFLWNANAPRLTSSSAMIGIDFFMIIVAQLLSNGGALEIPDREICLPRRPETACNFPQPVYKYAVCHRTLRAANMYRRFQAAAWPAHPEPGRPIHNAYFGLPRRPAPSKHPSVWNSVVAP